MEQQRWFQEATRVFGNRDTYVHATEPCLEKFASNSVKGGEEGQFEFATVQPGGSGGCSENKIDVLLGDEDGTLYTNLTPDLSSSQCAPRTRAKKVKVFMFERPFLFKSAEPISACRSLVGIPR